MGRQLDCAGKRLDLSTPVIMGVLNVTPDSFSDGGDFFSPQQAVAHAKKMVDEGATIIDIGGESTRPGAKAVSVEEELARVIPVIEALASAMPNTFLSIDTSKPEVMKAAVEAGAGLVNDVCALQSTAALETLAELQVPVCLMHMQGEPRTMQASPRYGNVVEEVLAYLASRVAACEAVGIAREQILIDPGFGFGKTLEHNLSLLKHLDRFSSLELPLLVGMSRKSMIGAVLDKAADERLYGSLALAALAAWQGAAIIRVHDVAASADVLKMCAAVMNAK